MHNIRQHANASEIEILLMWDHGRPNLLLRDDGIGIAEAMLAQGARRTSRRARDARTGGLVVTSQAGEGTEVARTVPERPAYRDYAVRRLGAHALLHRIRRLVRR